jgi:hypothetical protein
VGLDAFRGLRNAPTYRDDLRKEFAHGKPVAIMEAGCCTYQGAGDYGGAGWYMAKEADGVTLKPDLVRDEGEQVRYLDDLMTVFEEEGVDSAFWFSFVGFATPHRRWPLCSVTVGRPALDSVTPSAGPQAGAGDHNVLIWPPSMVNSAPVMLPASGEARKRARSATS